MSGAGLRAFLAIVMLAVAIPASACINTFSIDFMRHKRSGDTGQLALALAEAEKNHREQPSLASANDLAVGWVLSGQIERGIQMLRDLEHNTPGSAVVAANLGTALELTGEDEEALRWIRESVRRDPTEHHGSEWVHARILEAKLALRRDPRWLHENSVLGWRAEQPPLRDEQGKPRRNIDIEAAIKHQLDERLVFVAAPDPIVGDLYVTLGDLELARTVRPERQGPMNGHIQALKFGTVHEARIRKLNTELQARFDQYLVARDEAERLAEARNEERRAEQRRRRLLALWVFGTMALIVAATYAWRRARPAPDRPT